MVFVNDWKLPNPFSRPAGLLLKLLILGFILLFAGRLRNSFPKPSLPRREALTLRPGVPLPKQGGKIPQTYPVSQAVPEALLSIFSIPLLEALVPADNQL